MASYLVTGASRGIGFEYIRQLSEDPKATVIGLVRNKKATEQKLAAELNRENIHIIEADLGDYDAIKRATAETSALTKGSLDYLIANAAYMSEWSEADSLSHLGQEDPKQLESDLREHFNINVIGNIHLFNLFLPLILKGNAKKVVAISTGMADEDLVAKYDIDMAAPYAISKAAMNLAVAKYSAEYRSKGVLFMSISPGYVDTGAYDRATDEHKEKFQTMGAKFAAYAPHFTGAITPEDSAKQVLSVIDKASIKGGFAGSFVSHLGNKQWL